MYAIEFETDITGKYIELENYQHVLNKHAKVIILFQDVEPPAAQKQLFEFQALIKKHENDPPLDVTVNIDALANEVGG